MDYGTESEAKLAPKWNEKSILTSKPDLCLEYTKTTGKLAFFWLSGVKVGSRNRCLIDPNMKPTWEAILESIFDRF